MCDAGSTDGTGAAVEAAYPGAHVVTAGPEVFWNGGMRRAWEVALQRLRPDFVLWLNDDTMLDDGALATLLETFDAVQAQGSTLSVVVGSTRDPGSGVVTYGGVIRRDKRRPMSYTLVAPGGAPVRAATMNGNAVLVSDAVTSAVGILEAGFTHGMGDYDYGHRVEQAGGQVWVAPGTVGTCARNPAAVGGSTVGATVRSLLSPKGLPPREWFLFARRWAGPLWPLYAASPYVRRVGVAVRERSRNVVRR